MYMISLETLTFVVKDCLLSSKLIIHTAELESVYLIIVFVRWDLDQCGEGGGGGFVMIMIIINIDIPGRSYDRVLV